MSLSVSIDTEQAAGQATYGRSNLRPADTGLPFIVFVSQKDDAEHAARVKWSPSPKVRPSDMGSYAIQPFGHVAGNRLTLVEERQLEQWVSLNLPVLKGYWNGDIPFTQDAVEQLRAVG